METNKIIRGSFILLTAITFIVGWLGFQILDRIDHLFDAYLYIPLCFFVFGFFYVYSLKCAVKQRSAKKIVTSFVAVRMTKLFASILILIFYGMLIKTHFKEFIFTFLAYYIIYLIVELGIFFIIKSDEIENEQQ